MKVVEKMSRISFDLCKPTLLPGIGSSECLLLTQSPSSFGNEKVTQEQHVNQEGFPGVANAFDGNAEKLASKLEGVRTRRRDKKLTKKKENEAIYDFEDASSFEKEVSLFCVNLTFTNGTFHIC